jgi:hypothetical protein
VLVCVSVSVSVCMCVWRVRICPPFPLTSSTAQVSNTGVELSWGTPAVATDTKTYPLSYLVYYRPAPTEQVLAQIMQATALLDHAIANLSSVHDTFLASQTVSPLSIYQLLLPWRPSMTSTATSSYLVPFSVLSSDAFFQFKVVAFSHELILNSDILTVNIADQRAIADGLYFSVSARRFSVQWNATTDPLAIAYMVEVLANDRGNAEQPFDFVNAAVIFAGRFSLNTTRLQFQCLSPVLSPAHPCIFPFTKYVVVMRILRSSGLNGAKQYLTVVTTEDRPEGLPKLVLQTPQGQNIIAYPPPFPNDLVVGARLVYHSQREKTPRSISIVIKPKTVTDSVLFHLANLTNYTEYNATVTFFLRSSSVTSAALRWLTEPTLPLPLAPPRYKIVKHSTFKVDWDAPDPLPGQILFYELVDVAGSSLYVGNETTASFPGQSTMIVCVRAATIVGVGPCSSYVSLVPINERGGENFVIALVMSLLMTALVALIVFLFILRRRKARLMEADMFEKMKTSIPPEVRQALDRLNGGRRVVPRQLDIAHLQLLDQLGEGKFGVVFKALLDESEVNNIPGYIVAVKISKSVATEKQKQEMMMEAVVMAQFAHPNVVNLIGHALSENGEFYAVTQYCEHGSLLSFLQEDDEDDIHAFALHFAIDIALGMAYIAESGFFHRDLAVRVFTCVHICVCVCVCVCE